MSQRNSARFTFKCPVCRGHHPLRHCYRFKGMDCAERIQAVHRYKLCKNCLAHSHTSSHCTSLVRCHQCREAHHTLLHQGTQMFVVENNVKRNVRDNDMVLLKMTAQVMAVAGRQKKITRILIDPSEEKSCISLSLALELKTTLIESIFDFGQPKCHIELRSCINPSVALMCALRTVKDNLGRYPAKSIDRKKVEESHPDLLCADSFYYKSLPVDIVIGADLYPKVIKISLREEPGAPTAQATIFGWTFRGLCPIAK